MVGAGFAFEQDLASFSINSSKREIKLAFLFLFPPRNKEVGAEEPKAFPKYFDFGHGAISWDDARR